MSRLDLAIQNAKNTFITDSTYASFGETSIKGRSMCMQIGLAGFLYWNLRLKLKELLEGDVVCLG